MTDTQGDSGEGGEGGLWATILLSGRGLFLTGLQLEIWTLVAVWILKATLSACSRCFCCSDGPEPCHGGWKSGWSYCGSNIHDRNTS